jgi:hypothetical protein
MFLSDSSAHSELELGKQIEASNCISCLLTKRANPLQNSLSTGFIEFHLHPEQRKGYESAEHFTDVQWLQYV